MRNLRFVAETTDGDPPVIRARCAEIDVAVSLDQSAFVRPVYALGAIVADAVAAKLPAGEDRRVVVDVVRGNDSDGHPLTPERLCDFELRSYLATLDAAGGQGRKFALRETIPA